MWKMVGWKTIKWGSGYGRLHRKRSQTRKVKQLKVAGADWSIFYQTKEQGRKRPTHFFDLEGLSFPVGVTATEQENFYPNTPVN